MNTVPTLAEVERGRTRLPEPPPPPPPPPPRELVLDVEGLVRTLARYALYGVLGSVAVVAVFALSASA